ncbi:class I poly(R)-hydroxyalkanoic acid synthase [Marinovum sp. SP66]|uniref:PHA/PHB synthase family protein n=1 Tax=Marinovum TaxID=367771 RepID=UPI00237A799A|nr:class I poly(R)-hydroxyalkanoic acid synthase [Marinovum sp. SP66]MDD9740400.1 class I poly(R)-hydroxyalkanoic acid synthase [Marinovum sp. SP66]
MTIEDAKQSNNIAHLDENIAKIDELTQRLTKALTLRKPPNPQIAAPESELFARAATAYWQEWMQNPAKILEHQVDYWGKSLKHIVEAQQLLAQGKLAAPEDNTPDDKRFSNPVWKSNPYFNFIKQQYMINSDAIKQAVEDIEDIDEKEKKRLRYFSQQIVDMMAPTNFFATNPDALMKAIETEGDSVVKGLENLVADLEANDGELVVRLADTEAFEVGGNIATTPGKVVFRNDMMELIQYSPSTDKVHEIPVVLFPPWINKFYILDLKDKNSFIKWVVDQGYTLFVVSWVNPDPTYADRGMEDYVEHGYLAAIEEAKKLCKVKQVNAIGYCIAGTTLNLVLALLKKRGDKSVKSATFFTTLTDFSDQGEFTPFLQDDFVDGIEAEVAQHGILRSFIMGRTMSFLRSNDLIYQPAIRSYMMGDTPPAFDLLYWNGDGSGLPGKMVMQYLRGLCQRNEMIEGTFELLGESLSIKDVTVPICAVATETDHIAPWKDCYRGFLQTGSRSRSFIVGQSGHIAGIVNPPTKKKYGHYVNDDLPDTAEEWMEGAEFHEGSWWPRWEAWLKPRAGKMIDARDAGDSEHPPLGDAPGDYVRVKASI